MEVNFNEDSWHSRFYSATYGDSLPNNLCGHFWKVVAGLILLPLTCWTYLPIFKKLNVDDLLDKCFFGVLIYLCFLVVAGMTTAIIQYPVTMGMILAGALGIILALFGILRFTKTERSSLLYSYLKARKEKVCPFIKWK